MIIELYSIPGAGKTTIIKSLTGGNATSFSKNRHAKAIVINFAKEVAKYMPSSLKYKKKIKQAVTSYAKRKPQFIERSFEKHLNSIVLVAWGYVKSSKDIYMDEGLIHRIITLSVNYGLSDQELIRVVGVFKDVLQRASCFYLDVPAEECFEGIKKRNRHKCEMDELTDDQLKVFLNRYAHCCELVKNNYHHETVTRSNYDVMRRNK